MVLFTCARCGRYETNRKNNMKRHYNIRCCPAYFSNASVEELLATLVQVQSQTPANTMHCCERCGHNFSSHQRLRGHIIQNICIDQPPGISVIPRVDLELERVDLELEIEDSVNSYCPSSVEDEVIPPECETDFSSNFQKPSEELQHWQRLGYALQYTNSEDASLKPSTGYLPSEQHDNKNSMPPVQMVVPAPMPITEEPPNDTIMPHAENTYLIRNHGNENTSHITDEMVLDAMHADRQGIVALFREIYLNDEHPENLTIMLVNVKEKTVKIRQNGKWSYGHAFDVIHNIQEKIRSIISKVHDRYLDRHVMCKQNVHTQQYDTKTRIMLQCGISNRFYKTHQEVCRDLFFELRNFSTPQRKQALLTA